MARYRKFKKYGNTDVIVMKPQDKIDLNLKYGDLIDIEDAVVKKSIPEELEEITEENLGKEK
jgi:hypothetical protein